MHVDGDTVGARHEIRPFRKISETVRDNHEQAIAFALTADFTENAVSLVVAIEKKAGISNVRTMVLTKIDVTYKFPKVSFPISAILGSLIIPNICTTSLYSGWLKNWAKILIYPKARWAFA